MTVKNGTPRQGLAARATAALRRLGFNATNGGNADPAARTTLLHTPGTDAAARSVARAVKVKPGTRIARADQPGLARNTVVLVLGPDFKGLAGRVAPSKPPASRPRRPPPPAPCRPGTLALLSGDRTFQPWRSGVCERRPEPPTGCPTGT